MLTVEDTVFPVVCSCGQGLTPRRDPRLPPQMVIWAQTAGDAECVGDLILSPAHDVYYPAHDVYYMDARINPPGLYVMRAHHAAPTVEAPLPAQNITITPGEYHIRLTVSGTAGSVITGATPALEQRAADVQTALHAVGASA